jgi:glycosyltransferase involved in cell wall biosynthesis
MVHRDVPEDAIASAVNRQRHVCMVVHSYYPVGEVRAEREARAAIEEGYDVTVICLKRPAEPEFETVDGVRIQRLPVEHLRGVGALRSIREYVGFAVRASVAVLRLHRTRRVDVAYVHAPPDFLVGAALAPRLLGSKVVIDIHDLSPHMFHARFGGRRLAHLLERTLYTVERAACSLAHEVVTVHGPYREELAAHGVPRDKITVVMNAPLPDSVERARDIAAENGQHENTFVVAYHGTVTHWYGVDLIVEAIAQLRERIPGLRGLILGEGDALPGIAATAERLGVAQLIDFPTKLVSQSEALSRVAGAHCGVVPNRPSPLNRFALSSKLLEYASVGVPVVAAKLETLAAHFNSDEVTYFEPDDVDALADAIRWVAEHPEQAKEKARRAEQRVRGYSWEANRENLLRVLARD